MSAKIKRRDFIRSTGRALATVTAYSLIGPGFFLKRAGAAPISLDGLRKALSSSDGTLVTTSDSEYEKRKRGYNLRISVFPKAVLLCKTPAAIQAAIRWARENNVPLNVRSGGHCFEGFSSGTGLLLDVSPMNSISVDPSGKSAKIGSGAKLGDVIKKLQEKKLVLTTGTCPTVGVAGLTLGGGYGMLSRKWGMTCDNLISLKMVMADGSLLNVSESENPELFWACRGGGGGQFGIVTEFNLKVHPLSEVLVFALRWDPSEFRSVVRTWQDFAPHAPDELTCHLNLTGLGEGKLNPVKAGGMYVSPVEGKSPSESALAQILKPLTSLGSPTLSKISGKTYLEAADYFAGGDDPPVFFKNKSAYGTERLSDDGISAFKHGLEGISGGPIAVILSAYGGAINKLAPDATAFPHRDGTLFGIQTICHWSKEAQTEMRLGVIRKLHQAMDPHLSGGAYVNYPDEDLKDWGKAYFGDNFERLKQVKAKYDPDGFFSIGIQTIPKA